MCATVSNPRWDDKSDSVTELEPLFKDSVFTWVTIRKTNIGNPFPTSQQPKHPSLVGNFPFSGNKTASAELSIVHFRLALIPSG